ncbi:MAG: PrsW family glutamic-type intramembrane protease [Coriobacteriia bacterium]|nr:PrsW family glutamic-type intramembrane protease [Coriobacteriia bacterium]
MYAESAFLLVAMPLVACLLCVEGRPRLIVASLIAGMTACLLSAYVSASFAQMLGAPPDMATVEISPFVEEVMKLLIPLFYLAVMLPKSDNINLCFIFVAVGFATMESAFYLLDAGAAEPGILAMRGLSAAMMHLSCGLLMAFGFARVWQHSWLRIAGTVGLLSFAITYHALYNLFIAAGGAAYYAAIIMPLATLLILLSAQRITGMLKAD